MNNNLVPVETAATTSVKENGWGGNQPLPVTEFKGSKGEKGTGTYWIIPRHLRRALKNDHCALSIVQMEDGSMSAKVVQVSIEKENKNEQ